MNILYLTNHLNIGGITSYVLTLGAGLKRKGHNIYIASSGGELLVKCKEAGFNFIYIPIRTKSEISPKILLSLMRLATLLKKHKIELMHSHSRTTQVLGCLIERLWGIPHISTCHGFFKRRFSRRVFPCWGRKVIAVSQQVKEHLVNDFKLDENNIVVIHNGIDINRFKAQGGRLAVELKRNFGLGDGPVVGNIARLSDVKGHIYLIEAMKIVCAKIPNAQLVIAGEGRMKQDLVRGAREIGLEKNVFFISGAIDTRDILSLTDVFVLPSLKEGLGLALMEAMAYGLPVIGSDIGGIKTLIKDGENGLLVRPADAQQLANAILGLLQDSAKAGFLAKKARVFIAENFSQEEMVQESERVYLECLR